MCGYQVLRFFISEDSGFCYESHAERDLKREAGATSFCYVDSEFGMLPKFELVLCHVKIAPGDLAEPNVRRSDYELTFRKAHRRRSVAAPAGLMEHQLAVFFAELVDDRDGFVSDFYSRNFRHAFPPDSTGDLIRKGTSLYLDPADAPW